MRLSQQLQEPRAIVVLNTYLEIWLVQVEHGHPKQHASNIARIRSDVITSVGTQLPMALVDTATCQRVLWVSLPIVTSILEIDIVTIPDTNPFPPSLLQTFVLSTAALTEASACM